MWYLSHAIHQKSPEIKTLKLVLDLTISTPSQKSPFLPFPWNTFVMFGGQACSIFVSRLVYKKQFYCVLTEQRKPANLAEIFGH